MWWRIVFTHSSRIKDSVSSCKKWNVLRKSITDNQKDWKCWNTYIENSISAHIFNCYKWIDFDVITSITVLLVESQVIHVIVNKMLKYLHVEYKFHLLWRLSHYNDSIDITYQHLENCSLDENCRKFWFVYC